jgi:hypothetical protein
VRYTRTLSIQLSPLAPAGVCRWSNTPSTSEAHLNPQEHPIRRRHGATIPYPLSCVAES